MLKNLFKIVPPAFLFLFFVKISQFAITLYYMKYQKEEILSPKFAKKHSAIDKKSHQPSQNQTRKVQPLSAKPEYMTPQHIGIPLCSGHKNFADYFVKSRIIKQEISVPSGSQISPLFCFLYDK